jgi:Xaa-Pro aminopeptidase
MLTAEGCAKRRERLWSHLPRPCDVLIVADPASLVYFANYVPSPFVFRTNESGAILVMQPEKATLVGDDMIGPFLDRSHVDEIVAPSWYDGKHATPIRQIHLIESTLAALEGMPGNRVGFELSSVPAGVVGGLRRARPDLEILNVAPIIRPMRRSKDADEIEVLKRSMTAGELGHAAALMLVEPGMTELEAYLIVQNAAMSELEDTAIVYGDFVAGPRVATARGGPPTARRIEKGDLLLLDFSVVVDGYRGDFTNTFAVGGGPTARQQELFEACVGALEAGESALKPGAPARGVDQAVRAHFASLGLEHAFLSHSGHGLGLGHPEPPYFVSDSDETIVEGDVVAIEPGLFIPGEGGMRFERNYLITDSGFETLSNHEIRIKQ